MGLARLALPPDAARSGALPCPAFAEPGLAPEAGAAPEPAFAGLGGAGLLAAEDGRGSPVGNPELSPPPSAPGATLPALPLTAPPPPRAFRPRC